MELLREVAEALDMKQDFLARKSLTLYLEKELRDTEAAIFKITSRYGVKSVFELDERLKQGRLKEEDMLDDFLELDYLEAKRDKIRRILEKIQ